MSGTHIEQSMLNYKLEKTLENYKKFNTKSLEIPDGYLNYKIISYLFFIKNLTIWINKNKKGWLANLSLHSTIRRE